MSEVTLYFTEKDTARKSQAIMTRGVLSNEPEVPKEREHLRLVGSQPSTSNLM